jgi:hypothetical protein
MKRSSQELGEKRFRALQTDRTPARRARTEFEIAGRQRANMTICTSSSIRTMTVGSGFSPDLLTPRARGRCLGGRTHRAGARGLADRPPVTAQSAYRRWGISPRPEDALIAGSTGGQRIQQPASHCRPALETSEKTSRVRGETCAPGPLGTVARTTSPLTARVARPPRAAHPSAAASPHSPSRGTRALRCRRDCAGCAAGPRRTRSRRPLRATAADLAR